ncbi:MAG TPA: VOC family protein [Rhizomicrobium sp.]|nr:VOC family protein [Rhizomicrobium sp.]
MSDQSEFYPMPSFPTLAVRDLDASVRWYEMLGFKTVFVMPGPGGAPVLAHLRWARYADLMLRPDPAHGNKGLGITLSFAVQDGLDAIAGRARANGAHLLREPGDRPWNARDFSIADPDGFELTFTMGPLKADMTMDQVVANVGRP